jgi:hypothetical protein
MIELDEKFIFIFIEDFDLPLNHPVDNYYFEVIDLSINLKINYKWLKWGLQFFKEISKNIKDLDFSQTINDSYTYKNFDNTILYKLEDSTYVETGGEVELDIAPDTIVFLKLKLTLGEFLLLNHVYKPAFATIQQ